MALSRLGPLLVVFLGACRGGSGSPAPAPVPGGDDGGTVVRPEEAQAVAPLVLGVPSIASYGYRGRAGHAAYKRARVAEAAGRWDEVVAACTESLAADPDHIEAAYLLAVARAKTGASPAAIAAPLVKALAADFNKWSAPALVQPALQAFFATPLGTALHARIGEARPACVAALARSLLVTTRGDLYAFDPEHPRWYRLTRTFGAVIGTFVVPSLSRLAYITRERVKGTAQLAVGLVDLALGVTRKPVVIPGAEAKPTLRVAYNKAKLGAFVVYTNTWFRVQDGDKLALVPVPNAEHAGYPAYLADAAWLDLEKRHARLGHLQVPNVTADWDEHTQASAMKLKSSGRVVTVPSPGVIDGTTIAWSDDHTQLAFAAQLVDGDTCTPGTPTMAAFITDAATGSTRELERATTGIAVQWLAGRKLAVAGDHGVGIYDLAAAEPAPTRLEGAESLAQPRRRAWCTTDAPPAPDESIDATEPAELDDATDL